MRAATLASLLFLAGFATAQAPPVGVPTGSAIQPVAASGQINPTPVIVAIPASPGDTMLRPAMQLGKPLKFQKPVEEGGQGYRIPFELPGPELLYRLDSESVLFERMKQEARDRRSAERIVFPDEPVLSKDPYYGRDWPAVQMAVEPTYVMHRRLFFEEKNAERYGWDLGVLAPAVSSLYFFKDTLLFPMHFGTRPCQRFETSAGKCLPGDPVPYMIYPPEITITGIAAGAAVVAGLLVLFP